MVFTPNTVASQVSKYMANAVSVASIWGGIIINVKEAPYLAKGDGVTDDTAAIQAAINAVTNGGTVVFPSGTYCISSTLTIGNGSASVASTVHNIFLQGVGAGDGNGTRIATKLKWIGTVNVSMMQFNGLISGGGIDKIEFDGNALAKHCIVVYSLNHFYFGLLMLNNFKDTGLIFTGEVGGTVGCSNGTIDQLLIGLNYAGTTGLTLDGTVGVGIAGLLFNRVVISGNGNGNTGIKMGFADHNTFITVSISYSTPLSGTNYGILLQGSTDGANGIFPYENIFINCNPGQGGVAQTTPSGYTPSKNYIVRMVTGDGSPVPTVSGIAGTCPDTGGTGEVMPFGLGSSPVIVGKEKRAVTTTAQANNIGSAFKAGQDAMLEICAFAYISNAVSSNAVAFGISYTDALSGTAKIAYFQPVVSTASPTVASSPMNGASNFGNGSYAMATLSIYVKAETAINIFYVDPTNTPNDQVSVVIKRVT